MKIVGAQEVYSLLSPRECIDVMRDAFQKLHANESIQYLRMITKLPYDNILGVMPAYHSGQYFGAKVITVYHQNLGTEYPSHQGVVLLFDARHGTPLACVDGGAITKIRTGAVSALATDLLAPKDASTAAFIGAGAQARSHFEAIFCIRPLKEIRVYDKNMEYAKQFALETSEQYDIKANFFETIEETVQGAQMINTITTSSEPILYHDYINSENGVHINAVGACASVDRELSSRLVSKARFFGDSRESVFHESGDFLFPLKEGLIGEDHYLGSLDGLLCGEVQGRINHNDITIFESLGLAIEDIAAAIHIYEKLL